MGWMSWNGTLSPGESSFLIKTQQETLDPVPRSSNLRSHKARSPAAVAALAHSICQNAHKSAIRMTIIICPGWLTVQ